MFELADRVGPAGRVCGIDVSAPMLERARERVRQGGLGNVDLILSDAAMYAFAPGSFDLAFSRFGVMFFDDSDAAFANIRSALAPGGRLTFICWAAAEDNPWLTVPFMAARPYLPPQPQADPLAPGPFAFADAARIRGILARTGYSSVDIAGHRTDIRIAGPGEAERAARFAAGSGPVSRAMATADAAAQAAAEQAILETFRRLEGLAGIELPGSVWVVSARA